MKQPGQLTLEEKATRACLYAAQHDIKEYEIKGNRMIYYSNYPELEATFKVIVRLNTMNVERQKLGYWNPKGNINMCK